MIYIMRINKNMMAMNTHRQLGINNNMTAESLEKLSSGYRINRAGDDAAGLAISEKMRGQIRGLNMVSKNSQDGISLIQTAEGGLNETHAILQRMRELAVQSANDTNVKVDRGEIQKEIDQLSREITRIADTTEFNTQNLLGGKFATKFHIGANEGQNVNLSINAMVANTLKVAEDPKAEFGVSENTSGDIAETSLISGEYTIEELPEATEIGNTGTLADAKYIIKDGDDVVGASTDGQTWKAVKSGSKGAIDAVDFTDAIEINLGAAVTSGTLTVTANGTSDYTVSGTAKADFAAGVEPLKAGEYTVVDDSGLKLQDSAGNVVAESADGANWTVDGATVLTTATLAADDKLTVASGGIDVSDQTAADKAITVINDAIQTVSAERSKLGAMQNRLEHTIKNLDTSAENLQAAESRT